MEHIATVRIAPIESLEEDEAEEYRCMEYEYNIDKFMNIVKWLESNSSVVEFNMIGNAIGVRVKSERIIIQLQKLVQDLEPKENVIIEWNYYIE